MTRSTTANTIYNAELNFAYNLSIQTGVGHFNSSPTYGYNEPNNVGKILSNQSKFSNDKIVYFQLESSRYQPYFTTFGWYDFNETVYNNCIMHFPNGKSYNYPEQSRDKNLYDYIVSIAQNNGILYVYIE